MPQRRRSRCAYLGTALVVVLVVSGVTLLAEPWVPPIGAAGAVPALLRDIAVGAGLAAAILWIASARGMRRFDVSRYPVWLPAVLGLVVAAFGPASVLSWSRSCPALTDAASLFRAT